MTRNSIRLSEEYQHAKPFRKEWVYQVLQFEMLQTSNILKYKNNRSDLLTIWNRDSFRQILKSPARSYEYLSSQFFRTTSRIQLGQGTFDKSGLVMTLTNFGVKGIVSNFRLSLEGTTDKEIHE